MPAIDDQHSNAFQTCQTAHPQCFITLDVEVDTAWIFFYWI